MERVHVRDRPELAHFDQADTPRYYPSGSKELAGEAHRRLHQATNAENIKLQGGNTSMNNEALIEAYKRAYSRSELQGIRGDLRTPKGNPIPGGANFPPSSAFDVLLKSYE